MTDTVGKEETLPTRPQTPDEQRRLRKHTLYQQLKARKVAERKEEPPDLSTAPERVSANSPTPPFSTTSKHSISSRRKEIIQKRTKRKEEEERSFQEQIDAGKEENTSNKLHSNWLNTSPKVSMDHSDLDVAVSKEELREHEECMSENVGVRDERPTLSEKGWDTRSILEHPPEPLVDPSWDTSKLHFDSKMEEASTSSKMEMEDIFDFDTNVDDSGIGMFDSGSWAKTDTAFSTDVVIEQEDAQMIKSVEKDVTSSDTIVKDVDKETTLVKDNIAEDSFETCEPTLVEAALLMNGANVKHVDASTDVDVGCYSSNTVFPAFKDDEELLTFDQVRSDDDGHDVSKACQLTNPLARQKRIEQYKERDDDPTSDNEGDDADSDNEDFANEEAIHYISADSTEDEELVAQIDDNSITVPETVGVSVQAEEFASFNAAASTACGANRKSSQIGAVTTRDRSKSELENIELINNNSSTSSGKAESSIIDSSAASSALFGENALSLAGTSVNTEATGTLATLRGIKMPPPPPPGSPTPKSSKSRSVMQKPLLKIPPPPPEKFKKWREEKMRPMKHLERNAGLAQTGESDGSMPFVTTSQDEIETTFSEGFVKEVSTAENRVDNEEATDDTLTDMDEATQIQVLNATSAKAGSATDTLMESPPHVSRMAVEDSSLVASSADGAWRDDDISKDARSSSVEKIVAIGSNKTPNEKSSSTLKLSPVSDSKMAERLALATCTAARTFEEKYPDVDGDDSLETIPVDSEKPSYDDVVPPEKPATSYFCAPDILAASICEPYEAEGNGEDDTLLNHFSSQVKGLGLMENAADDQFRPLSIYGSSFDDTHHAGLELVGGAFSMWQNSVYAYGPEPEATVSGSTDKVVATAVASLISKPKETAAQEPIDDAGSSEEVQLLSWLERVILPLSSDTSPEEVVIESDQKVDASGHAALARSKLQALLKVDANLNSLCKYASENIVMVKSLDDSSDSGDNGLNGHTPRLHPFSIPTDASERPRSPVLAANFVSFLNRASLLSGIESPFKDENPFIFDIVTASMSGKDIGETESVREACTMQELVFQHELGDVFGIVRFFFKACGAHSQVDDVRKSVQPERETDLEVITETRKAPPAKPSSLLHKIPTESPCPFETAIWSMPSIVAIVLGFLGDPVVVCRMKIVNRFCNRLIHENEHVIMRDAVRLGGISMHLRPAFWMWITLEKCGRYTLREDHRDEATTPKESSQEVNKASGDDGVNSPLEYQSKCITVMLPVLEKRGREGKWHHVIQRDVSRAFGNMPPHKTGARLRTDSIVRALVTWGRGRVLMRGVKGGGVAPPTPTIGGLQKQKSKLRPATGPPPWERDDGDADDNSSFKAPTETVTQWSGVSPVPSFNSSPESKSFPDEAGSSAQQSNFASDVSRALERDRRPLVGKNSRAIEELALSGNTLTNEMKAGLQNQLGYVLHALAAAHEDVGYCQGMDYIVAHLLRVLQDTVRYHSIRGTLCPVIGAQPEIPSVDSDEQSLSTQIDQAIDSSLVVEETVFRVMDTFFTTYNLRHMYWPELRCLKTCCRVFERLIQMKLPVLADHFAYHELNVGLFALGWFQTLFLYLPSMPSATVCHMWDIWLVERSFKIFFRVGTAILFLSQPILLNHELEGMMTYLNTFPDATLLNPDILIACALQIKVTNRMLMEIEREVTVGI